MSAKTRYDAVAIILHWLIAAMLVGMIFFGWWMGDLPDEDFVRKFEAYQLHKSFGILILALSLVRLGWRLAHKAPPLPETMKGWEKALARATHWAFYALMIGMPLGGWAVASASPLNIPTVVFGLFELPRLPVPRGEETEALLAFLHGRGAWAILILLALHAGAAIKHHIHDRDDVLTRMIPLLKPMKGKPE